jgi:hypothetical protein
MLARVCIVREQSVVLLSDRPIVCTAEDQFGLQPFAATLAKGLREMTPAEGMVVALHAPWGSGKTSALNLVQRHLSVLDIAELTAKPVEELAALSAARSDAPTEEERELAQSWSNLSRHHRERCKTTVVRFNPWFFSGQVSLFKAFFDVLGTELSIANDTAVAAAAKAILKRGPEAGIALGTGAGFAAAGPAGAAGGAAITGLFGRLLKDLFDKSQSLESSLQKLREAPREQDDI